MLRDNLYRLSTNMPNVNKIELLERKETKDKIYTLNKWYGKNIFPPSIHQFIRLDGIAWLDKAEWSKNEYVCNWSYEPYIFQDHINAHGRNVYSTEGKYTAINLTGDIHINLEQYPFVVLVPAVTREKIIDESIDIILLLIKENFSALIKGLEEYVKENKMIGHA